MVKERGGRLIISIDYDGTISDYAFPELGVPMEGAIETMRDLSLAGHILILNTCREDEKGRAYLTEAVTFLRSHGIEFASVNTNRPEHDFRDGGGRKVFAELYIDDKNLGGFPGWGAVRELFKLDPLA